MSCGCKGIRKCYICDPSLPRVEKQTEKLFIYSKTLRKCVAYMKNDQTNDYEVVGFDFPGVLLHENFISESEQQSLIDNMDMEAWKLSQSGRNKQDFGPKVNFKKQKVNYKSFSGLPGYSQKVVDRFHQLVELEDFEPVELCNLEYQSSRGAGIDPHFDDSWLWGERLVTINLLTDTWYTMTLPVKEYDFTKEQLRVLTSDEMHMLEKDDILQLLSNSENKSVTDLTKVAVRIPLKTRSLIVLSGEARHKWMHEIRRDDITGRRICCTFRELSSEFLDGKRNELGATLLKIACSFDGKVVL